MKVVKPEQMSEIDKIAIEKYGIPGIILMENAALKVVEEIDKTIGCISGKKAVIFAGKGNNGGDAFAVARHLFNRGAFVTIYIIGSIDSIKGDAAVNLGILNKMGLKPVELDKPETQEFKETHKLIIKNLTLSLNYTDIVIDGIFGTGLRGEITGIAKHIISTVNSSGKAVISIDIPSGINGSSGEIMGTCIKADKTISFGLPKIGLITHPGCEYTGEIVIADIGIPKAVIESIDIKTHVIDKDIALPIIPKRTNQSNKGDYGRTLIITGSTGMTGAGCLAAGAALRAGAGLVYLGVPSSLAYIYNTVVKEAITVSMDDLGKGYISSGIINTFERYIEGKDVIAVGPGLSVNEDIFRIVSWLIENSYIPLVLDADALNAVAKDVSILGKLRAPAVITPHPGEMARLMGTSIAEVQRDRIKAAGDFALRWNVITVLKGWHTVVALPDGRIFINTCGNPGMATAGTGDVLTGLIAGLMAQKLKPEDAAVVGVFIHGTAGDWVAGRIGEHGLIAGDLVEEIPYVMNQISYR